MFDLLFDVVGMGLMGCVNEFGDVMNLIVKEGCGVLVLLCDVYMKFEIGDEVSFQILCQYGLGVQILFLLGLLDIMFLINLFKFKVIGFEVYGLSIVDIIKIEVFK